MSDMIQPLRALLGGSGGRVARPMTCGGALLRVDYESYRALERTRGVVWATRSDDVPRDGTRIDARVACNGEAMAKRSGLGYLAQYGTCAECAGLELTMREATEAAKGRP